MVEEVPGNVIVLDPFEVQDNDNLVPDLKAIGIVVYEGIFIDNTEVKENPNLVKQINLVSVDQIGTKDLVGRFAQNRANVVDQNPVDTNHIEIRTVQQANQALNLVEVVVDILALSIVFNHLPDYLDYQIGDGNPSVFYASSNYVLPSMAVLGIMVKDIVGIV